MASSPFDFLKKGTSLLSTVRDFFYSAKQAKNANALCVNILIMMRVRIRIIRELEVYLDYLTSVKTPDPKVTLILWEQVRMDSIDLCDLVSGLKWMINEGIFLGSLKRTMIAHELMLFSDDILEYLRRPDPMHTDEEIELLMKMTADLRAILEKLKEIAFEFDSELSQKIGYELGERGRYKQTRKLR